MNEKQPTPHQLLQRYWGYTTFREPQEAIIGSVLNNRDTLVLMPTGGGKSLCYQIPALARKGLTIVITPLIALMQDQVLQLRQRKIAAQALHTGMTKKHITNTLDRAIQGKITILYLSPERLQTQTLVERIPHLNISLIAVDEAHCISQWGYDFRPAYLQIPLFAKHLPNIPIIALTATATPEVQRDIQAKLGMKQPAIFQTTYARANLYYGVQYSENKTQHLLRHLASSSGPAIIYTNSRAKTEHIARTLQQRQVSAEYYHAHLPSEERSPRQERWLREATRVIVATNAFGMGIDKANVRLVIHESPPKTLEAYYQEAGRAGRDSHPSSAILLYNDNDTDLLIKTTKHDKITVDYLRLLYQHLANHHQVAVGSHPTKAYPLDIPHFASLYNQPIRKVTEAIQNLVAAQLIQYNTYGDATERMQITLPSKQLPAFCNANPTYYPLLQRLLRQHPGRIRHTLTPISTKRIAHQLKVHHRDLLQQIEELQRLNVIDFIPAQTTPTILYLTARYPAEKIPISRKSYQERQKIGQQKAQQIIHYLTNTHRCRTQMLLEYLGEVRYDRCHNCDYCKRKEGEPQDYTAAICAVLTKSPTTLHGLMKEIAPQDQEAFGKSVRYLLSREEIYYDEKRNLALRKSNLSKGEKR